LFCSQNAPVPAGPASPAVRVDVSRGGVGAPVAPPRMEPAAAARGPSPAFNAPRPPAGEGRAPDGQRYFVRLRNQTTGPFDLATLQRLARQGQVSRLHQVSTDQQTWKGAGTVEGLFS
jgi:hypothetical protein